MKFMRVAGTIRICRNQLSRAEAGEVVLSELQVGWDRPALTTVVVFCPLLLPVHYGGDRSW